MDITYFSLYGERCSGTNFVRKLVFDNFDLTFCRRPDIGMAGWKHFFGTPENEEAIRKSKEWCIAIAVVRNPIDYFVSFFKNPHHQTPERTTDFETFLMSEFYSVRSHTREELPEDHNLNDFTKRYKNLFELRSVKLKYLHSVMPAITPNYVLVRLEDLMANPEKILEEWQMKFNLHRVSDHYIVEKKRVLPQAKQWFRFELSETAPVESYTVDDPHIKDIIRANLDFEAEALVGYDKESILKRLV